MAVHFNTNDNEQLVREYERVCQEKKKLEAENARLKEQRDKAANLLRTAITSGGIRVMNYKLLARARNEILKEIESEE